MSNSDKEESFNVWDPTTWGQDYPAIGAIDKNNKFTAPPFTEEALFKQHPNRPGTIDPEITLPNIDRPQDFNTLVNQVRHRNTFFGELGVNQIIALAYEIGMECKENYSYMAYETGMDEVRRAMLDVHNVGREAFNRRLQAYIAEVTKQSEALKKQGLMLTNSGKVKPNLHNAKRLLSQHPEYANRFKYNQFSLNIEDRELGDSLQKADILRITTHINSIDNFDFVSTVVMDAITLMAHENQYHPILNYLYALKWDGVDRLSKAGARYWGTNTSIEDVFIHKFLLGAIARVVEPGCKVDTFPVFEGAQGIRKSTALRILAGDRYFIDHLPDLTTKDVYLQMAGMWIIEMAELDVLSRSETSRIKAFSSTAVDRYRAPYEAAPRNVPRSSVLAGTVNKSEYLTDETGNRRVWPIICGIISTQALAVDRDQIWAQALHEYRNGATWWLTPQEELIHAPIAKSRLESGVIDELISQWLDGYRYISGAGMILDDTAKAGVKRDRFTAVDAANGIGMDVTKLTRAKEMEIGRAFRKFGYVSKVARVKSGVARCWCKEG